MRVGELRKSFSIFKRLHPYHYDWARLPSVGDRTSV